MMKGSFEVQSVEETWRLAAELARELKPGDVLCLEGELGAGKTTFTQGLAHALGVPGRVTSPTFSTGSTARTTYWRSAGRTTSRAARSWSSSGPSGRGASSRRRPGTCPSTIWGKNHAASPLTTRRLL